MQRMDETGVPIALVVKGCESLLGTITDGDIRRWILGGGSIDAFAENAMNVKPVVEWTARIDAPHPAWCTLVPVLDLKGNIIGLRDLRSPAQSATVVIMAGGLGTRLRPLTNDTPKPMLEVGGKPIIVRLVEQLVAQGLNDIYISVGYKADVIKDHFGTSRYGATINYLEEDSARGTAGALALLPKTTAPVLVVNGDVMTDVDFRKMIAFHTEHGADATMAVRKYKMECPYGVVNIDDLLITGIVEKPEIGVNVNAGIYVLGPEVMQDLRECVGSIVAACDSSQFHMTNLIDIAVNTGRNAQAFLLLESWIDVGTPEAFAEAQKEYGE